MKRSGLVYTSHLSLHCINFVVVSLIPLSISLARDYGELTPTINARWKMIDEVAEVFDWMIIEEAQRECSVNQQKRAEVPGLFARAALQLLTQQ